MKRRSWAQSGTLTVRSPQRVTMQAQFERSSVYTVQFEIGSRAGSFIRAEAEVTWCVAGNRVIRRISPQSSVGITGVAEAVQVAVYDVSPVGAPAGDYPVSITVAPGKRAGSVTPPTLYDPLGVFSVAPGDAHSINVPQLVGVCSMTVWARSEAPLGEVGVELTDGIVEIVPLISYDPRQILGWMPIQAGTTRVKIYNDSAVFPVTGSLVWGVDG